MRLDAGREAQTTWQFLANDLLSVVAEHHMDFMRSRVEVIKQPLRVKRTAGPGDGDKDFQSSIRSLPVWVRVGWQTSFASSRTSGHIKLLTEFTFKTELRQS